MNDDERFMDGAYERRRDRWMDHLLDQLFAKNDPRHKWHLHLEMPEKETTSEDLRRIVELMQGINPELRYEAGEHRCYGRIEPKE